MGSVIGGNDHVVRPAGLRVAGDDPTRGCRENGWAPSGPRARRPAVAAAGPSPPGTPGVPARKVRGLHRRCHGAVSRVESPRGRQTAGKATRGSQTRHRPPQPNAGPRRCSAPLRPRASERGRSSAAEASAEPKRRVVQERRAHRFTSACTHDRRRGTRPRRASRARRPRAGGGGEKEGSLVRATTRSRPSRCPVHASPKRCAAQAPSAPPQREGEHKARASTPSEAVPNTD